MPLEHILARHLPHDIARLGLRMLQSAKYRNLNAMRAEKLRPFFDHRCIFVHIPKCAGTSVVEALFGQSVANHRTVAALRMVFSQEEYRTFYKFTFVRNPWDRLVSTYYYLRDAPPGTQARVWGDKLILPHGSFTDFVRAEIDEGKIVNAYHFRQQNQFVCLGPDYLPDMDFIGRFENIERDFGIVCGHLGIDATLPESNRGLSRPRSYRDEYDDETRDIVARAYARDINLFDYEF